MERIFEFIKGCAVTIYNFWHDIFGGFMSGMLSRIENVLASIEALYFQIPDQIFIALDSLTNVVGYIMPLRLYTPIITFVIGYWFIMISVSALKAGFSVVKNFIPLKIKK